MSWFSLKHLNGLKRLNAMLPGLLIGSTVAFLFHAGAWSALEQLATNQLLRLRGPLPWDERLVIVAIDDATLGQLGQFPLPRRHYTQLLKTLTEADSTIVAFDLLLVEPSAEDELLAQAMAEHGGVVLAEAWSADLNLLLPNPQLADNAIAIGHIQQQTDSDGMVRQVNLLYGHAPALSVAIAQAYSLVADIVSIPNEPILKLNWPGPVSGIRQVSLVDVLAGKIEPSLFANKIVLVGGTATGLVQLRTPFDTVHPVEGVYVHAVALQNLLQNNWFRTLPKTGMLWALILAGPLLSWLLKRYSFAQQLMLWLGLSLGWFLVCFIALDQNYLLPIVPPLMLLGLTEGTIALFDRMRTNALLQARGEFLNTMSHEIRTPLNAIIGISEMMQETQLTARQREFADTIHHSSQTLLALINDVLDFSKIEAGKLILEQYPINLRTCIEQSLDIVAPRAAEKKLDLVYAIEPTTPLIILSDPVRLRQILLNLLSNAVKFTERGEISLIVQAKPLEQVAATLPLKSLSSGISRLNHRSPEEYELSFSVRDTGIGIPPERIADIFKPFSQVSASTTRQYGGTGLGLSISKRLAEIMGGKLWVTSQVGKGSTFSFSIQAAAELFPVNQTLPTTLSYWINKRLLLIDRNKTRCMSLLWQLQSLDIQTIVTRSVAEGLVLMQQGQQFDAILLDAAVTKIDNISALESLRQSSGNPQLPCILMATLSDNPTQGWPKHTLIVWKPIKQAALYRALVKLAQKDFTEVFMPSVKLLEDLSVPLSQRFAAVHTTTILIAEDSMLNQRIVQGLLEMLGYASDTVNNGQQVLDKLRHQSYDIIFMDMRMPEKDGIATTRAIRQLGSQIAQPWIIALTANAAPEDRSQCIKAGMNDYLSKPIRREALAQALTQFNTVRMDALQSEGD
jgi:signal transduction histidine kinase/CheY-like chemotaxis protein